MRICFVAFHFIPVVGGAEVRTQKLASRLQAMGHEVTVLTLRLRKDGRRQETMDGYAVVRFGGLYREGGELRVGRMGIWPAGLRMAWWLWRQRARYDVIQATQLTPLAALAAVVGTIAGKPVVITIGGAGPTPEQRVRLEEQGSLMADSLGSAAWLAVDRSWMISGDLFHMPRAAVGGSALFWLVRHSDAILHALSSRSYADLLARGFPRRRVVRISGSVDTERFRPSPALRADRAQDERTMVCVARLDFAKGVDVLLHAWARLLRGSPEWRAGLRIALHIVGDGPLRAQMERLAGELGIAQDVEFLGERTDVVGILQAAWGFVMPSRWEGMPNALLEAMACGLAPVATRVSGSEDIIVNEENGLLVEPEQPAELAAALQRIIGDPDLAARLGKRARETVERDYQLSHNAEQLLALYQQLLRPCGRNDGE